MAPSKTRRVHAAGRSVSRLTAAAVALVVAVVAVSEPLYPLFLVNQTGGMVHTEPDGGVTGSGTYVVVWQRIDTERVLHRRFSSSGAPLMDETPVSDVPSRYERAAHVAVRPDGSFFVAWYDRTGAAADSHIFGRRFGPNGAPLTSEFRVSTNSYVVTNLDIATAPSGASLVVWTRAFGDGSSHSISAQRFASSGAPIAGEFRVNTITANEQRSPVVSPLGQNGFVVVWSTQQADETFDVVAQIFDAAGQPVGGEIPVNSYTTNSQVGATVAADGAGNFIVAWTSGGQAGESGDGVFAQRFTPTGNRIQFEFRVNTATTGTQTGPAAFVDTQGRTVIAYHDSGTMAYREFARDGTPKTNGALGQGASAVSLNGLGDGTAVAVWRTAEYAVFAQGFSLSPDPIGAEFRVNTYTTGIQDEPAVAGNADGSFVVAWASQPSASLHNVKVQRFSPANAPVGFETLVSDASFNSFDPDVASSANGDFVVVWQSDAVDFPLGHRRYSASGTPLTGVVPIGEFAGPFDVARSPAGPFVVVWRAYQYDDIHARRYAASGAPEGAVFRVNTTTAGSQAAPRVSSDGAGNFAVVWTSADGGGLGVFGQRMSASGQSLGPEFRVNAATTDAQEDPDVAVFLDGSFVVAWGSGVGDGSSSAILARRFTPAGAPIGGDFRVNSVTEGYQMRPRLAVRDEGVAVVWHSLPSVLSDDRFSKAQLYARSGASIGAEFQIARHPSGLVSYPEAAFAGQDLVVVRKDYGVAGFGTEVFGRRYRARLCAPGDANGDGLVNVSDILFLINFLYAQGPAPTSCANANGDALTNVADILYLINYLYAGGPNPV